MNTDIITPAQYMVGRIAAARADGQAYYVVDYPANGWKDQEGNWKGGPDDWEYQRTKSTYEGIVLGAGLSVSSWRSTPDPTDNPRSVVMAVVWDEAGREQAIKDGYEF